ncbi:non-lysosomal glucosylceramidase [Cloeon dipterum]|uniref:non-lysosomal glucosylceramidase n=1 Tax=Cloeon dipterum TaxID=197152 RepID=UPI00321FD324
MSGRQEAALCSTPQHGYGWKVKLNHVFPERRNQRVKPKLKQLPPLIPLGLRYLTWALNILKDGKRPLMNYFKMKTGKQIYGAPIGGIGAGTIGRGFRGEFCRYQMRPGMYSYHVLAANQFLVTIRNSEGTTVYQQVLSPHKKPKSNRLSSWKWEFDGSNAQYCALYPRAWTEYKIHEHKVTLTCRQVSPVIPHNYKDSSLPCAVFVWDVENGSNEDLQISITMTFKNGTGGKDDKKGNCWTEAFDEAGGDVKGVMIHQVIRAMRCTYGIACSNNENITTETHFNPNGPGYEIWQPLQTKGELNTKSEEYRPGNAREEVGCAVSCKNTVQANSKGRAEFALVWDMPQVQFSGSSTTYRRFYTKYFGSDGKAAPKIAAYALQNYKSWEKEIETWQEPILNDSGLPDWYKSAIFNELYFVSDGGSIWVEVDESEKLPADDPRMEYGRFGYLEGHEYRMYNTYDVHFYASFALTQLWPQLQKVLQYDIRDSISKEDLSRRKHLYDGQKAIRKSAGSVPHDVGDPEEDPFVNINSYPIHDVADWRDLNSKFVLQVFRDFTLWKDLAYLKAMWPQACTVIQKSLAWDKDDDGLIENGGFPDQTYDSWIMTGASAYCGSLWLASLHSMVEMGRALGESTELYETTLHKGKAAFEAKLWNGEYYNFDSSGAPHSSSIMSDQLCGHWYLRACGVTDKVFPKENVKKALTTIFNNNVMKFKNGTMGAVNGMLPSGNKDLFTIQSEEVWVGTVYALAAVMMHEGMVEESFKTAAGIYQTVYDRIGMGFETPEALYEEKYYRAIGYMRPLSIWAIQLAWEQLNSAK